MIICHRVPNTFLRLVCGCLFFGLTLFIASVRARNFFLGYRDLRHYNASLFYFLGTMKASFPVISGFEVVSDKVTASSKMQIPTVSSQRLLMRLFRSARRGCRSEAIYIKHLLCIYTLYTTDVLFLTNLKFFSQYINPFPPYIGLPVHFVYG